MPLHRDAGDDDDDEQGKFNEDEEEVARKLTARDRRAATRTADSMVLSIMNALIVCWCFALPLI